MGSLLFPLCCWWLLCCCSIPYPGLDEMDDGFEDEIVPVPGVSG